MKSNGKSFRSLNSKGTIFYRVIDVATSKIKFADTLSLEGEYPLNVTINYLGEAAGVNILNSFFPGSLAKKQPPKKSRTTLEQIQKFGDDSLNKLKKESKDDW